MTEPFIWRIKHYHTTDGYYLNNSNWADFVELLKAELIIQKYGFKPALTMLKASVSQAIYMHWLKNIYICK